MTFASLCLTYFIQYDTLYVAANGMIFFFFMGKQYSIVYMYHIFLIYPFVDEYIIGWFHVLVIVNNSETNIVVYISFQIICFSGVA